MRVFGVLGRAKIQYDSKAVYSLVNLRDELADAIYNYHLTSRDETSELQKAILRGMRF